MKSLFVYCAFLGMSVITSYSTAQNANIEVHGHWKLEIFESDWTPVRTVEFENALLGNGKDALMRLLTRAETTGSWLVSIDNPDNDLCHGVGTGPCYAFEPAFGVTPSGTEFNTLVLGSGSSPNFEITLSGHIQVTNGGTATFSVSRVSTNLYTCSAATAPATSCTVGNQQDVHPFTEKTLAAPVPVQNGQFVQFTVTLSFS